jgi:hypothetical protein
MTWKTGIDITVENPICNEKEDIDLELNIGKSKYYPEGPKCKFRGKEVDCLTLHPRVAELLVPFLSKFSNTSMEFSCLRSTLEDQSQCLL